MADAGGRLSAAISGAQGSHGSMPLLPTPPGSIEDFIGLLAGQTDKVATIDEINEAISDSWAGIR